MFVISTVQQKGCWQGSLLVHCWIEVGQGGVWGAPLWYQELVEPSQQPRPGAAHAVCGPAWACCTTLGQQICCAQCSPGRDDCIVPIGLCRVQRSQGHYKLQSVSWGEHRWAVQPPGSFLVGQDAMSAVKPASTQHRLAPGVPAAAHVQGHQLPVTMSVPRHLSQLLRRNLTSFSPTPFLVALGLYW